MKRLWVAAALAPLSFAAAARAQVTISNQVSTPIFTATANNGQPSDVTIGSGGSVTPKNGGTPASPLAAVTINSSNNVTNNGTISFRDLNDAVGIQGQGGNTGSIDNEGSITLDESATQKINGTNGIAEGIFQNNAFVSNFALGTDRTGIQVIGTSPLIGNVTNGTSASITVVGENSAGISIGSGGITGNLTDSGTITVTGDGSFGIHSAGPIGGNVSVSGALSVTGNGAVGLALDQGANGNVDISAAITDTGFHSLTPPVTAKLVDSLTSNQLMSGGPAVTISGSVGSGISIDAPVAAVAASGSTPAVAASSGGAITASGSTGMVIGGANPITIGAGSSGASLLVGGTVTSTGIYNNFNATGIQIGNGSGAAVNMPGGIDISGTVTATTVATNLSATDGAGNPINGTAIGLHLESGAAVSGITVGAPNVIGGGLTATSTSTVANTVTALQIDSGATRVGANGATLNNFGTISASITGIGAVIGGAPAAGGTVGAATAVSDQAGVLGTINNTGAISATITPIVPLQVETGTTYALDLRGNTTNVTVNQTQADIIPATSSTSATTPAAPSITGDVLFGSGNANLNLLAGTLTGAVSFGTGTNSLDIENGATLTGALSETKGGSLALSVGVAPSTVASTLNNTGTSNIGLSSLNIGSHGQVLFTLDPNGGAGASFTVAGNVNLAAGAKIGVNLISAISTVQTFTLVTTTGTGILTSAQPAQSLIGQTPFLFNASVTETTGLDGSIVATVSPKTAAQLGLNAAEASAYTAIFDRLAASGADADPEVTADVLSKNYRGSFIHLYDQFLPDYEGGPFDSLVVAQGQIAQAEADPPLKLQTDETRGWVQEIGYLDDRQQTSSANGYHASGFGFIGGLEQARGDSAVGVTAAFLTSGVGDVREGPGGVLSTAGVEAGVYWRAGAADDGLNLHASLNGGYLFLSNHRLLFDEDSAGTVNLFREAKSQWNGLTGAGEVGASYYIPLGRFYMRPEVIADYVYLYEGAFTEHGGGPAEDLAVASRSSSEASVQGDLVIGADMGGAYHLRPEMTLGWREVVSGGPGDTTARFVSGGPSFSLSPKFDDKGSLIARLGVRAGGQFADFSANAGGQYNTTYQVYDARAVARFLF